MAEIYLKGGTEHTLILDVREAHIRPFQATDWTDLRVGFFLSLTNETTDDDPSGLAETITNPAWTDRVQIGVIDRGTGTVFFGYSNLPRRAQLASPEDSKLVSSDIGIGTTNTRYWRPSHSGPNSGNYDAVHVIDGGRSRATASDGSQMHLVQDPATAGGYCTLLALRLRRDNATSRARIITMEVKKATAGGHSSDILFSTDPSLDVLEAQLEAFPSTVNTLGPIEVAHVPDTFWLYWPFHQSRLRIHAIGILKVA